MLKKRVLSLSAMDKIIRQAGAYRVSDKAKESMAEALEEQGKDLAREAKKLAEHAGRRTVTEKDIKLAIKNRISG